MTRPSFDEKKLDEIFVHLNSCHLPGAAIGIAIGGKPVYRKGFGLASLELPIVLSPSIRMPIGSTTKHFACLAYLLLCEEGKASLDDTIGQYFPELHPRILKITIRQLMGHVGGLRDAYELSMLFSGIECEVSAKEVIDLYRDIDDLSAEPGTAWSYNNGGYLLLTAITERIAGKPFEEILRERILEPAGMWNTALRRFDSQMLPNCVSLHVAKPNGRFVRGFRPVEGVGQGGIYSTVDDMLRWLAHMDAPKVGKRETWALMKTPQTLANGNSTGYGLGLMTGNYRGVEVVSHAGGVVGGNSQMLKVPAAGLDVAIMVNRSDVSGALLVYKVLNACLDGLKPIETPAERTLAQGLYRSSVTGRVIRLFAQGDQQMVLIDGDELPFTADAEGTLRPHPPGAVARQCVTLKGSKEKPSAIRFDYCGNVDELVAIEAVEKADADAIAGDYRSAATGTAVTVSREGPRLKTVGRFGSATFALKPLARGIWHARAIGSLPMSGVLSFDEDGKGFRFSSGRTRGLVFRRVS